MNLVSAFSLVCILLASPTQECAEKKMFKKGTKLTYENSKGSKVVGTELHEVISTENKNNYLHAQLKGSTTSKGKTNSWQYKIACDGAHMLVDLKGLVDQEALSNGGGAGIDTKVVSSENIDFPYQAKPGTLLGNSKLDIQVLFGSKPIGTVQVICKNRKVELLETLQVAGNSYECVKITGEVHMTTKVMTVNKTEISKSVTWFHKDLGPVKMMSYSSQGKLESMRVLKSVE
ncbi:MAG: hypothetical protein MUF42_13760 [Cytophagaceae bacterium]|jgi:hypothetical protein|nr:hypothetical protein [Cytophagaceae bacterium]